MTRRILVGAISASLFAPYASYATSGQQVANGVSLLLAPDNYVTSALPTLSVLNAGSITADGGVSLNASGSSGIGAQVNGQGSWLVFSGGSISTSGPYGYGVYTLAGGSATIGRDSQGAGTSITTSANYGYGLYGTDAGTVINAVGATINTSGGASYGARISGAELLLANSSISTIGNTSYGVYADASTFDPAAQGQVVLNKVSISTQGSSSHAVYLDGSRAGVTATITGGSFTTSGNQSVGIYLTQGAQATVTGASAQTTGTSSYGISMNQDGSQIALDRVSVTTAGNNADAVWAPSNTIITASNFDIHTTGGTALGFDNRASTITLTNGSILTEGANSHALYASQESSSAAVIFGENLDIQTKGAGAVGAWARLGGQISLSDSTIATTGDTSVGVRTGGGSTVLLTDTNIETGGTTAYGVYAQGVVNMLNGTIHTTGQGAYGVAVADGGQMSLRGVDVMTDGIDAVGIAFGGTTSASEGGAFGMDGGSLISMQSHALAAAGNTDINLSNGVQAIGGSGVLLDVRDVVGQVTLTMDNSVDAQGDIVFDPSLLGGAIPAANTMVSLSNGSKWTGATQNAVSTLSLDSGSLWVMTGDSSLGQLALSNSTIQFAPPESDNYKTLVVNGDLSGAGGVIGMNTLLNEGGVLGNQHTDRLLILGNVTTTGTVLLDITPQGDGAATGASDDGTVSPSEGISLVQVAGSSRADAFALKNGYAAVGPWKYTLYAFEPGQTDPAQNAMNSGTFNWDYRLASAYVGEADGSPDASTNNVTPQDESRPDAPVRVRPAVVPQMPSYIVAPTALLNYGDSMIDTLHQRLGEIRDATPSDPHGGELFVRYVGSQEQYSSNLGFADYGFGFDQQINALQLGGSIVSWTADNSSLRAGWALDKGTTRVTPNAPDGASVGRYDAHGVSAWMTWQQANGFYVDAVLGGEHYRGDVDTQARNSAVANLRAGSWTASVEMGYPFALGKGWSLEPQAQLKHQSLTFNDFADADGLSTQINVGGLTATRVGARLVKTDDTRFSPYLRADFIRTTGGDSQIGTSSSAWDASGVFSGGRLGNSYRLGAGATSQWTSHLALYGEADYRRGTASHGLRGWQANMGLRFDF
ncbi:autotransporter outer membrane beta-barrel domain-containing protein [Dyella caseinilytica]|uniref:Autotransporter outer membrane beta-barrel domain-containing protein n=2 Tax=Dyella caseinilytica TaxID=1849581 RepID=A0ABX7GU98_9GAMM|nr:autotransporter outer membrane beta-barrel domain-containing protein [Dyella caseinilytica]QRN54025.1 autotransporter outer membrane beta-barrel domain-containing protein [Dyella caseinilytica]GFZ91047.1 autotransporter [Dyella caseinilytica]